MVSYIALIPSMIELAFDPLRNFLMNVSWAKHPAAELFPYPKRKLDIAETRIIWGESQTMSGLGTLKSYHKIEKTGESGVPGNCWSIVMLSILNHLGFSPYFGNFHLFNQLNCLLMIVSK